MIYNTEYAAELLLQYLESEGLEISSDKKQALLNNSQVVDLLGEWSNDKDAINNYKRHIATHMATLVARYKKSTDQARYSYGSKVKGSIARLASLHNALHELECNLDEHTTELYYLCIS